MYDILIQLYSITEGDLHAVLYEYTCTYQYHEQVTCQRVWVPNERVIGMKEEVCSGIREGVVVMGATLETHLLTHPKITESRGK